jgi:hypothetical protein
MMLAMMLNVDNDIGDDVSNDIHDSDKINWTPHYAMCIIKKKCQYDMWHVYSPRET